ARIAAEDVGETGGDDHSQAVVRQCPYRVLTGGSGTEIRTGHQHTAPIEGFGVQNEVRIRSPGREESVLESGSADPLQIDRRDDLIGIDIGSAQRNPDPLVHGEGLHLILLSLIRLRRGDLLAGQSRSAGEDSVPRTAVAAATSGDTRWVRPPLPCLPSKFRFEVDAQRWPGASWSGFMPRHIEQPAARHSAPASVKTLSRPSSSAALRTRIDP